MGIFRKENGVPVSKAGFTGTIDNILNKFSNNAVSNKAVTEEFDRINADLIELERRGAMPNLDYRNYLHVFSSTAPSDLPTGATYGLSFTATKECYICGYVYSGPINICVLSINGTQIATSVDVEYNGQRRCGCYLSPLKIDTGDIVSVTFDASMLHIFEEK